LRSKLGRIYRLLEKHFGDLGWWPADSPFEVMVGAVLTQNTAWANVEKAVENLKLRGLMDPGKIEKVDVLRLAGIIRPAGYYKAKSRSLKEISRFLRRECGGDIKKLKGQETSELRQKLLSVKGVGPETADSILVYALGRPVFVVDAYTKRIFLRHGLIPGEASYDLVQSLVRDNFPEDAAKLNQFHALLVETAKRYCRKRDPLCGDCPLGNMRKRQKEVNDDIRAVREKEG